MEPLDLFLVIFLKPFIAVVVFFFVFVIAALLERVIPDGRIKRILYSPLPGHRKR